MGFDKRSMEEMLREHVRTCRGCGKKRTVLSFEELPAAKQKDFEENREHIDYCLHCPHCDDYSWISKETFSSEDEDEAPDLPKSISLNSACPCGSGKYKRCCGKLN
jgi:hypothetical protein